MWVGADAVGALFPAMLRCCDNGTAPGGAELRIVSRKEAIVSVAPSSNAEKGNAELICTIAFAASRYSPIGSRPKDESQNTLDLLENRACLITTCMLIPTLWLEQSLGSGQYAAQRCYGQVVTQRLCNKSRTQA